MFNPFIEKRRCPACGKKVDNIWESTGTCGKCRDNMD